MWTLKNKKTNKIETEQADSCQRGEDLRGLVKRVKRIKKYKLGSYRTVTEM